MTVETPMSAVNSCRTRNNHFSSNLLTDNMLQKLQKEKYSLNFLLKCRGLKRPPPSLRCTGFKALDEPERISLISSVETESLKKAIADKQKKIKLLEYSLNKNKNIFLHH